MYRDNEVGRVGAVMAAKAARDQAAMVAAALELWLAPPEQPGPDAAARDVWQALVEADAVVAARNLAMKPLRDGAALRPHAYIDLVESIAAPATLLELVEVALDKQLSVLPYLATPCFALIDGGHEDALWRLVQRRDADFAKTTDRWVLVAVILTTSRIGDRHDLARWFTDFGARAGVPMWIIAAYLCTKLQTGAAAAELASIAAQGLASARRDPTAGLLAGIQLVGHLKRDELDAFYALLEREQAALAWPSPESNPLVLYLNTAKHANAVDVVDLTFDFSQYDAVSTGGLIRVAASSQSKRPPNWRVGLLLQEGGWLAHVARVVPWFPRMRDLPARDPGVLPLYREMKQQAMPSTVPAANAAWERLARTKLSFFQRLKMTFA